MNALPLVITRIGQERLAAAQLDGTLSLTIARVAFTDTAFVPAPTLLALPGEHRRLATVSGVVVDGTTVHLTIRDDVGTAYGVRGLGLFLSDGTLFAVYGQPGRMVEKSAQVALFIALDLAFPVAGIDRLTFGATNFLLPPATTEAKGVVEIATIEEADAGTAGPIVVTAALLFRGIGNLATAVVAEIARATATARSYTDKSVGDLATAVTQAIAGVTSRTIYGSGLVKGGGDLTASRTLTVDAASGAETRAGGRADLAVTPAALAGAGAVYVVQQSLVPNGGYRVWSDGLQECWGSIAVPAQSTVTVRLPIDHGSFVAPAGAAGAIAQDEQMLGILNIGLTGFDVRNRNPVAATYYWQTKGV